MPPPLVSVAIPAYNHARYIEACLASVCAQSYPELELVLVDDGSTDDTFAVASRYLASCRGRFRHLTMLQQENMGVSATSNACIAACRGTWVHLLGSDDRLYPTKVERIQAAIERWRCPDLALVYADADFIDEEGNQFSPHKPIAKRPPGPDYDAWRQIFFSENFIVNPTIALNREIFLAAGGFDTTLALEDIDCWLRLSSSHAIARVPELLASYRKHPNNTLRKRTRMLGALLHSYGKFVATHGNGLPPDELRRHFRKFLWQFWRRVRRKQPWWLPLTIQSAFASYLRTPRATDYRRLGAILDRLAAFHPY